MKSSLIYNKKNYHRVFDLIIISNNIYNILTKNIIYLVIEIICFRSQKLFDSLDYILD
jgi:hypothetical protein